MNRQRGFFTVPPVATLMTGLTLFFAALAVIFYFSYRSAVNDLATYRAEVEAAQEQVRVENERKHQELMAVNARLDAGWSGALRELAARPTLIRVRPNSCPGAVQALPAAPSGVDEASVERFVSTEQCETIANNAVQDTAQLIWLQEWVKQAHEATK